jgi:hypothetical protein
MRTVEGFAFPLLLVTVALLIITRGMQRGIPNSELLTAAKVTGCIIEILSERS